MDEAYRQWLDVFFWRKVTKTDGCWEFEGGRQITYPYSPLKSTLAHRLSYYLKHRPDLLPLCDNVPGHYLAKLCPSHKCVNPDHYTLTQPQQDPRRPQMQVKQSEAAQAASAPRCKLTEEQAIEALLMAARGVPTSDLAEKFNVTQSVIYHMVIGRHYRQWDKVNQLREALKLDRRMELDHKSRAERIKLRALAHRKLRRRLCEV